MCLIVVKPAGTALPQEKYLRAGARRNSDGLGLAYQKEGQDVILKKDFENIEEMITYLNENVTQEDDLIVHFRLATHGLKDKGNRHPFPLSKEETLLRSLELTTDAVAAHNGVLSQYSRTDQTNLSDSQRFIADILSEDAVKNNLDNEGIQMLINEFLGGDRLAVLRKNHGILMFGDWTEDEGISYSNSNFKPYEYSNNTRTRNYTRDNWFQDEYSHWGERLDSMHQSIHHGGQNQKKNGGANIKGDCEGCGKHKHVKLSTYKEKEYLLCKKCRQKAKKGNLPIKNKKIEKIDASNLTPEDFLNAGIQASSFENEVPFWQCSSCTVENQADKLTLLFGSYLVCDECKEKFCKDPKQKILFENV